MSNSGLVDWQSFILEFVNKVDVNSVYDKAWALGSGLLLAIGGTIWIVGFIASLVRESIKFGDAEYGEVVINFFKAGLFMSLYGFAWWLIIQIINVVLIYANDGMGIKAVFGLYGHAMAQIKEHSDANASFFSDLWSINPLSLISFALYFVSFLVVVAVYMASRILHSLCVALAMVWGAIVIPSSTFVNLTKGWYMLIGLVIVWPLFDLIFLSFLAMVASSPLETMVESMLGTPTIGADDVTMSLQMALILVNFLLVLLLCLAPIFAARLIANAEVGTAAGAGLGLMAKMTQDQALKGAELALKSGANKGAGMGAAGVNALGQMLNAMGLDTSGFGAQAPSQSADMLGANQPSLGGNSSDGGFGGQPQSTPSMSPPSPPSGGGAGNAMNSPSSNAPNMADTGSPSAMNQPNTSAQGDSNTHSGSATSQPSNNHQGSRETHSGGMGNQPSSPNPSASNADTQSAMSQPTSGAAANSANPNRATNPQNSTPQGASSTHSGSMTNQPSASAQTASGTDLGSGINQPSSPQSTESGANADTASDMQQPTPNSQGENATGSNANTAGENREQTPDARGNNQGNRERADTPNRNGQQPATQPELSEEQQAAKKKAQARRGAIIQRNRRS